MILAKKKKDTLKNGAEQSPEINPYVYKYSQLNFFLQKCSNYTVE